MSKLRSAGVPLVLLLIAAGASAATFIVPTDKDLVREAKGIVIAKATGSHVVPGDGDMIYTVYDFDVEEVIKGAISSSRLQVVEIGGFIGDRGVSVPGTPAYRTGERALLFLDDRNGGEWRTWGMGIGKFNFVRDLHGAALLMRGQDDEAIFGWDSAGNAFHDVIRSEEKFLSFVREEACGGTGDPSYTIDESKVVLQRKIKANVNGSGFHACDYASSVGGAGGACGGKWQTIFDQPGGGGSVAWVLNGTQAGVNGPNGINAGMGAWNGDSLSNVNFGVGSGSSNIFFDNSAGVTATCGGAAVGCTQTSFSGSPFTFDTGTFVPITGNTIWFKAGFTSNQTAFDQVACHELGHALGFRHSDQGTPATTAAVMVATAGPSFFGANLQSWDRDAVETMYNPSPGVTCNPPGVPTVAANPSSISSGGTSQLSSTATGTSPTFTWFTGSPGNTSNQVGTGATINVSPTTTTSYWVRASNGCGTQNSASSVTVTVTCAPPSSANAGANPQIIVSGGSSQLSVTNSGSGPFTYQWFTGNPPSGTPINGATSNPITITNITTTTNFYVDVTNSCGRVSSNAVTVTVQACSPPTTASAGASPQSIIAGSSTLLSLTNNGTGPFTYQWFTGNPPNGTIITGATANTLQQSPGVTTTYYVQVSNACGGPINSSTVTVTVSSSCTPPSGAVATATPNSIQSGQSANLNVTANGTGLSFAWFIGTPPNGAATGATGPSVSVSPTTTTTYFARATGQCGSPVDSNAVTVNVSAACADPSIITNPQDQAVVVGASATLIVSATGSPTLHFQWFEGATGDTSKPRGGDSSTFNTGPLTKKTQFWVQVRGSCPGDHRANSNTATVDVKSPRNGRPVKH